MIFKVLYQDEGQVPTRETTKTMFIEAEDKVEARRLMEEKTVCLVEYIQPLEGGHLKYEQEHNPDFEVVKFE